MAFIFGGGIGSSGVSGLFGSTGTSTRSIVGIGADLLSASYSAQLTSRTLSTFSFAQQSAVDVDVTEDVTTPWDTDLLNDETGNARSLDNKVREIRELSAILDLTDSSLDSVSSNPDRFATFALYKALDRMKTLAEYASQDSTISSSLERLDTQFQQGFTEIRDFLAEGTTDKLEIFLGNKEYNTETAARQGKNNIEQNLTGIADNATDVISGLTGTEVFTISFTKSGTTEDIQIDLSGMTTSLTLNNVKDYINQQIEAVLLTDESGANVLDSEGNTQAKYLTRMDVALMDNGKYGLQLDSSLTEQVSFSAAVNESAIYMSGNMSQLDTSFATTSRLVEFANITGTLTQDKVTSFAATDLAASEIKALTADTTTEELDPAIQKLRDEMRDAAILEQQQQDSDPTNDTVVETAAVDEDEGSITNIYSDTRVNADTVSQKTLVDSKGNMYVVGHTKGSFGNQINVASDKDVFLTKFDSEGNLQFSRLLGVADSADAYGMALDSNDNIVITGQTNDAVKLQTTSDTLAGNLTGDIIDGTLDTFVAKYDSAGTEVFRYQLDTAGTTQGLSIAIDSANDIYIGGSTSSSFSGSTAFGGGTDGMLLKLDGSSGTLQSSTLIGDSTSEKISQVAIASDGNLLVAIEDSGIARLKKLDATDPTNELFSIDLGTMGSQGEITGMAVNGSQVVLSGYSYYSSIDSSGTATVNGSYAGNREGFVASFTDNSTSVSADYLTFIGTSNNDKVSGLAINGGKIYVAGSTSGDLNGQTKTGNSDGFVSRLDATTGAIESTTLFGEGLANMDVTSMAFTDKGNSVLGTLGIPQGTVKFDQTLNLETQTSIRAGDHFYIAIDGGTRTKIEINAGDDYTDIARRMRIAGFGKFTVEVTSTSEGDKLKISTLDPKGSPTLDLIAGSDGQDALEKMGLPAGRLLSKNDVFDIDEDDDDTPKGPEDVGGTFGLKLEGALHIKDKTTAKYVLGLLDTAITTIQRAERSLTYNPLAELLKQNALNNEAPPERITAQIANYQSALARLQSSSQAGPSSLLL